jgi:hypothetical protein
MVRGFDAIPPFAQLRANLPLPMNRTYPPGPAVEALVRGVRRRAPRVCGQRWLPLMQVIRGLAPSVFGRIGQKQLGELEPIFAEIGIGATQPVGPGGSAGATPAQPTG